MYVCQLINNGKWNAEVLNHFFTQGEQNEIQNIPLSMYDTANVWSWHFTKDERQALSIGLSTEPSHEPWKSVWQASVPPKIKNFGWRVMHNGVPVRENLGKRGLCEDVRCPVCGEEVELIMRLLVICDEARHIWYYSPLRLDTV
ncbi:hypothetical protein RDABS01_029698 [Bienertia sinuspersici]